MKFEELSVRAANAVVNLTPLNSTWRKRQGIVRRAIKAHALYPGSRLLKFYGWSQHKELCEWCNIKLPKKSGPTFKHFEAALKWKASQK